MKYLTVVRHAEAEPFGWNGSDFERNLTKKGINDAERTVRKALHSISVPQILAASPAHRALQTARIFASAFRISPDAVLTDMLIYTGSASDLLQVIAHWDDALESAVLVGHNPAVAELVMRLYPQFAGAFPTCAACSLAFRAERWRELVETPPVLRFQSP